MPAPLQQPPAAWFAMPEPDEPRELASQRAGQFSGHALTWSREPFWGGEFTPRGVNYDLFHRRQIVSAEGDILHVGDVLVDAVPASFRMSVEEAVAHYDSTGLLVAQVRAIEGTHGLWLSGAVTASADEQMVDEVRRRRLSGAWWRVDGQLSLISLGAPRLTPIERVGFDLVLSSDSRGATGGVIDRGVLRVFGEAATTGEDDAGSCGANSSGDSERPN